MKITVAWSPLSTGNFQLATSFPLYIWELAFWNAAAVSLNELYLLQCATVQNSGI
jgi:hypothetical protein